MKFALIWNNISYWHFPSGCFGINVRIIYDSAFPHNSCPQDRSWTEEKSHADFTLLLQLSWLGRGRMPGGGGQGTGFTGADWGSNADSGMDRLYDLETTVYTRGWQTISVKSQLVSIFGFAYHIACVATTQLPNCYHVKITIGLLKLP